MTLLALFVLTMTLPRGPYPQNVTRDSFYLLWETPTRMSCTVSIKGQDQEERTQTTRNELDHQVRFDGLTPHTRYDYTVTCQGTTWKGHVKTAPGPGTPFSFLVYGDNRWDKTQHRSVVKAMLGMGGEFVINTGDLVHDGRVRRYWYSFFRIEEPLLASIPLYPAPGNHENPLSSKGSRYWHRFFELPHNGPAEEFIYYFDWGNSRFFVLDYNRPFVASSQGRWLRAMLEETAMTPEISHIFVVVHKSPYTSGPHGPNRELRQSGLVDDMRRYGVDILFAGHDHIYERGRAKGLNYVISGGGGAPIYYVRRNEPYSLVTEPTLHYIRVDVDGPTVSLTAYRLDGTILDFMVLRKNMEGGIKVEVIKEGKKKLVRHPVGTPDNDDDDENTSTDATSPSRNTNIRSQKNESLPWWGLVIALMLLGASGWAVYRRYS